MKKPLRYVFSTVFALLTHVACAEEAIYGIWVRGSERQEKMEFFDCDGKLCAKGVIPLPDGSPPPLILRHASKTSANHWKGELFNPENGKTYSGKITLENPKELTLTGCLFAFLCQSETWTKAPKDQPAVRAPRDSSAAPAQKSSPAPKNQASTPTKKLAPASGTKNLPPSTGPKNPGAAH
jgi:uncharacterized protein (DUF2147 family)